MISSSIGAAPGSSEEDDVPAAAGKEASGEAPVRNNAVNGITAIAIMKNKNRLI